MSSVSKKIMQAAAGADGVDFGVISLSSPTDDESTRRRGSFPTSSNSLHQRLLVNPQKIV